MKRNILVLLIISSLLVGCSSQQNGSADSTTTTMNSSVATATSQVTTTPKITTAENTTVTTTTPIVTTTIPVSTTIKPVSTTKPITTTTSKKTTVTTPPITTTTVETTTEITTTADTIAPVITPYIYKKGVLSKSSWMYTHESYTVYQSSEACKWYQDGEQVTDNYVSSYVVKKGKAATTIYCEDMSGNVSKELNQKLKITQTPKLEYVTKVIDDVQTLVVYANEPVYFIINGIQQGSLKTTLTLTATTTYDIAAVDEENHESAHFSAYIKNDNIEVVTTTDCGCTYIP